MPSLQDMRERAKEAGLMKLDKLIENRQHIPTNDFPIPVKELCERYEKLYTGCINDVLRENCLLNQNLPSDIMPLRDEMTVCGEAFTVKSAPNVMIEGEMTFRAQMLDVEFRLLSRIEFPNQFLQTGAPSDDDDLVHASVHDAAFPSFRIQITFRPSDSPTNRA